ncbi:ClpP family protease [Nocardioides flavescens]|uniref:ATP-dependent Clp protease proteolytic subunit n=1 Tax=Nocardioides flavescens TaxID=2691959 RepID=A0A6L7F1C9_9ACTN|nr:ATP-dependent Clp protease proteolytic subunit [Nocardioides flavescens]MXG88774.1 ATP-dependent Clp protease proteolytic subunit [Nocardioides flavescens]
MSSYAIPYVTTQTPRGERTVDIYSRLLADRIVYLGTGIDDGVANAVIAQLLHLENESPDAPVSLYVNSPGGSIPATLAIYDAMQFIRPRVETTCVGQAAATAALLLAGGAPGSRSILAHGRVVLHAPAAEGRGAIPDLILEAEEVERVRTLQEEILAAHSGRTASQVRDDTARELVLTPAAAVEYGVVDAVLRER